MQISDAYTIKPRGIPPAVDAGLKPESCYISGPAIVLYIAVAKLIINSLLAGRYGYHVDEFYYLAQSEHLDWGYVDCPPLIALIAFLVRHTLGESLLALRFLPILAGALLIWITGAITREIGGNRFAQGLSALAVLVTYPGVGTLLTMNAFESLIWAGCAYFAITATKVNAPKYWLWFGALVGIGLENKYSTAVFVLGLVIGLALSSSRKSLLSGYFWLGAVLATLIFLPNLIWLARHHFPFLDWRLSIRASDKVYQPEYVDYLRDELMVTLPSFIVWTPDVWFLLFSEIGKKCRFLGWAFLFVWVFFMVTSSKAYYALPAYTIALAGGATALQEMTAQRDWRWLRCAIVACVAAVGMLVAPCYLPILPIDKVAPYERFLGLPLPVRYEPYMVQSELPPAFAWEFGWPELVSAVGRVYNSLPEEDRARAGILTAGYGSAGAIDLWGKRYGLPRAICIHLGYRDWGPRQYTGDVLVVVEWPFRGLQPFCRSVQPGAILDNPYGYSGQRGPIINVCRGPHFDLQREWADLKHTY